MAGSTKSRYKITKQKKQQSKCWYTLEWTIKTRVHLKRAHCLVVTNWVYLLLARVIHVVALSHWNISVSHSWGKKEDSASASASQWMQITRVTTSHHLLWGCCERFFNSKFVQCTKKLIRFSLSLSSSTVLTLLESARLAHMQVLADLFYGTSYVRYCHFHLTRTCTMFHYTHINVLMFVTWHTAQQIVWRICMRRGFIRAAGINLLACQNRAATQEKSN